MAVVAQHDQVVRVEDGVPLVVDVVVVPEVSMTFLAAAAGPAQDFLLALTP